MNLLSIETASQSLSLALFSQQKLLEDFSLPADGRGHAEKLLPEILSLLNRHSLSLKKIEAIAVSAGPGSFTSLRVGMATALGLVQGGQDTKKLYAVPTLRAFARGGSKALWRAPQLLAGRGRIYSALFECDGDHLIEKIPVGVYEADDFKKQAVEFSSTIDFFGPATSNPPIFPKASDVGHAVFLDHLLPVTLHKFHPIYCQEPDITPPKKSV